MNCTTCAKCKEPATRGYSYKKLASIPYNIRPKGKGLISLNISVTNTESRYLCNSCRVEALKEISVLMYMMYHLDDTYPLV